MSSTSDKENVGIALALVVAAGASTAVGAAVVFFPSIVKLASRRVLAGSLGFSAGVMTYVSFVEIFVKSQQSFEEMGHEPTDAYLYATLSTFAGVIVMIVLNSAVTYLLGGHGHGHHNRHHSTQAPSANSIEDNNNNNPTESGTTRQAVANNAASTGTAITAPACCSDDPNAQLESLNQMASVLAGEQHEESDNDERKDSKVGRDDEAGDDGNEDEKEDDFVENLPLGGNDDDDRGEDAEPAEGEGNNASPKTLDEAENNKRLVRMGINTALAIGLHNFPEGLATFVAALDDPRVGAILAFAIAIHNVPEGLCVALPIYYATGNRSKAFMWAVLSGASEFVAALLGWAVLANSFSGNLYGFLFGLVTGMMVIISVRELLPTAHIYDPQDTVVTYSYICGMGVIAVSLVMFVV